jgi:hypothetical protein
MSTGWLAILAAVRIASIVKPVFSASEMSQPFGGVASRQGTWAIQPRVLLHLGRRR